MVGGCLPYERRCFRHVHHSDGGGGDSGFAIHREEADSAPAVDGVLFGNGGGGHVVGLHVIRWHGRIAVDRLRCRGTLGLSMSTSQTVLYRRAASEHIGTSSGLLRTSIYIGSIGASSLSGVFFGETVTDGGLHGIGITVAVLGVAALLATVMDRTLR